MSVDLKNEIKGKTIAWNLNGTANIVAESDNEVHIIELVSSIYPKHYINPYLLSLAYIAENDDSKDVFLDIIPLKMNSKPIQIDLSELEIEEKADSTHKAKVILNKIYRKAFVENYHKVLPIDLFKESSLNYYSYLGKFSGEHNNLWQYFNNAKMFDIKEVSGFKDEKDFMEKWEKEKEEQLKLFPKALVDIFVERKGEED